MGDVHDKATRSYNMSRIRAKDTKPELLVRKFLWANGFRYRLHVKSLPGTPDLVLPKYKTVVFVHGCFWHGHEGCKYFKLPQTRREWWRAKILRTQVIDREAEEALRKLGWKVLVVWECGLKGKGRSTRLVELMGEILGGEGY